MAAILQLRKGTNSDLSSIGNLSIGELFYNTDREVLQIGTGTSNVTLSRLGINTGSIEFTGDITLGGSIFLGDADTDNIIIQGELSSSIIPDADNTYDLGSATKQWRNVNAVNGLFGNGIISGSSQVVEALPSGLVSGSSAVSSSIGSDGSGNAVSNTIDLHIIPTALFGSETEFDQRVRLAGDNIFTFSNIKGSGGPHTVYLGLTNGIVSGSEQLSSIFLSKLGDSVLSSSAQITDLGFISSSDSNTSLNSYTASNDINITNLHSTTESLDSRLDNVEAATSSYLTTVDISTDTNLAVSDTSEVNMILTGDTLSAELIGGVVSGSSQVDADSITNFDSNVKDKLDADGVISGSSQVNYSQLSGINNNIISASSDTSQVDMIINGGSISANLKGGVISGSIQILGGSNVLSSSNENFNEFSSSVDNRLDTIEGPLSTSLDSRLDSLETDSHTHANKANLDTVNQNLSTTSNVTFNTGSFTGDMTITGDLTVLGSATEISSTELRIEDKLITVASGSVDSAAADGAGIEIDGANKSIQWDHNTTSFVLDAKVSSSVGFKGEGGELTGIDTDQVTEGSNLYYTDTRVKTKLDADGVISGSSQVNYINLNSIPAGIVSGSSQVSYVDLSNIPADILSGSTHINTSLNSYTASNDITNTVQDSRLDQLSTETGSISSEQTAQDTRLSTLETETGSIDTAQTVQDSRLDQLSTETGSIDTAQTVQDSRLDQLSTETGSIETEQAEQDVRLNQISAATSSYLTTVDISADTNLAVSDTSEVNMILSGDTLSAELIGGVVSGSSFVSNHQGSITASINGTATNVDLGLNTNDSPSFSSLSLSGLVTSSDSVLTALFVDSNQVKFNSLGTAALLHFSSSIADGSSQVIGTAQATKNYVDAQLIEAGAGDITEVNAGLGLSGGAFSGSATLTLDTGSSHFTIGVTNIAGGAVDLGSLNEYTASNDINITNIHSTTASFEDRLDQLSTETGSISSEQLVQDTRLDQLSAFTGSVSGDFVDNAELAAATGALETKDTAQDLRLDQLSTETGSISTEQAAQDSRLSNLEANSGSYLTTVDISSDTNLAVSETDQVDMILTDDTLSANLKGGVVSGSSQIDVENTTNFSSINQYSDSKVKDKLDTDGVISGSSQVVGILASVNSYTSSNDTRVNQLAAATGSYLTSIGTIDISSGTNLAVSDTNQVNMILTDDTLSANLKGGVVSGSAQIDVQNTTNYSSINQYSDSKVKDKLDTDGVISGSAQLTTDFDTRYLNTGGDGVISGSSQIDHDATTNFVAGEHFLQSAITTVGTVTTGNVQAILPSGVISGSNQLSSTFESRGTGIISGSSQVDHDSTTNFVANEHIDHSSISVGSGKGLSGGGTIDTNRSIFLDTGSAHFDDGIKKIIDDDGVHSGSIAISNVTELSNLTADEGAQLENIGTTTISATQWGYLGGTDQELYTGADVTFNDINASGDVVISGDFTVLGSATEISTSELSIEDKLITVASGSANSSAANGGGIEIDRGSDANASITWNHSGTRFDINNGIHVTGTIQATDDIIAYASSDERLKDDIQPIKNPIEKINSISGNSFVWNEDKQDIYKGKDYGVIAQEIEKILPELVTTKENGYKAVKYDKLVSLLIEGIKDLSKEVQELKNKIK